MKIRERVLVTGASRGIGEAVALALASAGYDLSLWARSGEAMETVAAACAAKGAHVEIAVVDVSDASSVQIAAERATWSSDGLAGVVLNAGAGMWRPLEDETTNAWDTTVATNLNGAFYVLRACVEHLKKAGGGLIVGISSDSALYPFPNRAAYAAAKTGMRALLETARLELRGAGVRISVLFPGRVDTSFKGGHSDAAPGTRPGALSADEVAGVVQYLFTMPRNVEMREVHMASLTSTFGPFSQCQES
ncbi:SDR family oxidoreductase [Paraburkholderia xenovorans]|uniref:SDR family oxidoreductase n=1 Tax=Paraburkholderia xenovorans TaxID=36873 RepID=UPI0038B841D6